MRKFANRREAGRKLGARVKKLGLAHPVVLALPRGGVPVAYEVARELGAPLDVIIVRKLGVPYQPELAMGAVDEDNIRVLNGRVLRSAQVTRTELEQVEQRERAQVEELAHLFRGKHSKLALEGREVVIVDDGMATGGTARAALQVARAHGARRLVLAIPVAPTRAVRELAIEASDIVVLDTPEPFRAAGDFYEDFTQTTDEEVVRLLDDAREHGPASMARHEEVEIPFGNVVLQGSLVVPEHPKGVIVFAHGSGSSRFSSRNQYVAQVLHEAGFATLLFDLLTPTEELHRDRAFDVALLGWRLGAATSWASQERELRGLPIGYFGASTGAAAALWAAADDPARIRAVVSRGGRPDLAMTRLGQVRAPTLLIVGENDTVVLELNESAARQLPCVHKVKVIPEATHLFEEPGTLRKAASAARDWFLRFVSEEKASRPHWPHFRRHDRSARAWR